MGQADQESQSRPGLLMYSWEMLRVSEYVETGRHVCEVEQFWQSQMDLMSWWNLTSFFFVCFACVMFAWNIAKPFATQACERCAELLKAPPCKACGQPVRDAQKNDPHPHLGLQISAISAFTFQILRSICCRTGLTGLTRFDSVWLGLTRFDYLDLSSISLALKLTLIKIDWNSTDVNVS